MASIAGTYQRQPSFARVRAAPFHQRTELLAARKSPLLPDCTLEGRAALGMCAGGAGSQAHFQCKWRAGTIAASGRSLISCDGICSDCLVALLCVGRLAVLRCVGYEICAERSWRAIGDPGGEISKLQRITCIYASPDGILYAAAEGGCIHSFAWDNDGVPSQGDGLVVKLQPGEIICKIHRACPTGSTLVVCTSLGRILSCAAPESAGRASRPRGDAVLVDDGVLQVGAILALSDAGLVISKVNRIYQIALGSVLKVERPPIVIEPLASPIVGIVPLSRDAVMAIGLGGRAQCFLVNLATGCVSRSVLPWMMVRAVEAIAGASSSGERGDGMMGEKGPLGKGLVGHAEYSEATQQDQESDPEEEEESEGGNSEDDHQVGECSQAFNGLVMSRCQRYGFVIESERRPYPLLSYARLFPFESGYDGGSGPDDFDDQRVFVSAALAFEACGDEGLAGSGASELCNGHRDEIDACDGYFAAIDPLERIFERIGADPTSSIAAKWREVQREEAIIECGRCPVCGKAAQMEAGPPKGLERSASCEEGHPSNVDCIALETIGEIGQMAKCHRCKRYASRETASMFQNVCPFCHGAFLSIVP